MKERPILFSGAMVRAILEGRKSQTRRVVKHSAWVEDGTDPDPHTGRSYSDWYVDLKRCPYGQPGDRLWVRETFQDVHPLQVAEGRYSQKGHAGIPGPPPVNYRTIYRADGDYYPRIHFDHPDGTRADGWPYRSVCTGADCTRRHKHPEEAFNGCIPSIHIPRWASRLILEITDVRVERLQGITADAAIAEGIETSDDDWRSYTSSATTRDPRCSFASLWESLNGPTSWNENPWVWAITFAVVKECPGCRETLDGQLVCCQPDAAALHQLGGDAE